MIVPRFGAGHRPVRRRELFALLPLRRGPDVLGVRRKAPPAPGHQRRVARDRGRGVQEMRVQMAHIRRQLRGQHQRLAEAADAVRRRVAHQIGEPGAPRRGIAGQAPRDAPAAQYPQRLLVEIFGQVQTLRPDLAVHRVDRLVGRVAQRDDLDVEPALFERRDLLGDKGLRETRIAFEDKGDPAPSFRSAPLMRCPAPGGRNVGGGRGKAISGRAD